MKPGQVPFVVKLTPVALNVPAFEQSPPDVLLATMEFLMFTVPPTKLEMPPPLLARLPDRVVKLTFAVPPKALAMPPPAIALLPDSVLLIIVTVPPSLSMPPPSVPAELPDNVLSVIVTMPSFQIPPPSVAAELPDNVLLTTVSLLFREFRMPPPDPLLDAFPESSTFMIVSVPTLMMAPPPLALPSLMVSLEIITAEGLRISNTRDAWLPLTVIAEAPGPLMVRSSVEMSSDPDVSVIVPVSSS